MEMDALMNEMIPKMRPDQPREYSEELLRKAGVTEAVALIGVRGFFGNGNSMGVYDDAIFLVSPSIYQSFNANTDPDGHRPGHGRSKDQGMATLKPGVWLYRFGLHHAQYECLVQAEDVTVIRDADDSVPPEQVFKFEGFKYYEDTGNFALQIHRGGSMHTGSLGCTTLAFPQWAEFIENVKIEMHLNGQTTIP